MKKNLKLFLSGILFLSLSVLPLFADEKNSCEDWDLSSTALGTSVTFAPEHFIYGLNVQHWWNAFGLDFTLGGNYSKNFDGSDESYICASFKPMLQVYKTDPSKTYMAKVYIWGLTATTGQILAEGKTVIKTPFDAIFGFGFGTEIISWKHLSLPIEVGFAGGFPNDPAFGFCSSFGLRFRF